MKKLFALFLSCCMLLTLTACGGTQSANIVVDGNVQAVVDTPGDSVVEGVITDKNGNTFVGFEADEKVDSVTNLIQKPEADTPVVEPAAPSSTPKGEYNEGMVLVKVEDAFSAAALGELKYTSAEPLYQGSKWHAVRLTDGADTAEAVSYLNGLSTIEKADFDYVMGVGADGEAKVTDNPNYDKQTNLGVHNIPYGWTQNDKHPGGSPDVIVAVIDTGVDYNHLDLRNNIWVNTAEIAGNGRDDDGNGYVDDIHGWDCVGNDKDPMDDNGHGTHVAGIIAAENNKEGGIGVAYNCKVMVLKAGNSSGYFNNSDIAEAIQYAYMNGASVINMSFGGSSISIAVEEALENAYNQCVLIAAAGNDARCNQPGCKVHIDAMAMYPAALSYVIGVMSTNANGSHVSSFSNYDHYPYNSIEYEVYAVGEAVSSTWPSNKYACLNGTSMAAPTVSGIAALLRSYYSDREVYSTKFIQSQIVNTGTVNPYNGILEETDTDHSVADVQEALTRIPTPEVNLYDYYIDDSTSISEKNNGNGVIDAGETVRLYISLHNRGGVASNVNVSIDTDRGMGMTDPYFTFVNPTMQLSDIGTYSVRESGDKYFEIIVSPDCPNDYLVDFNIRYTYKNGLDEKDKTVYEDDGKQKARFNVSRGYRLPATITEDTVYTADRLYIVGEDVVIPEGVTVTFEEGCEIQFYDDREYYNSPMIIVYGALNLNGSQSNLIKISPSERYVAYACKMKIYGHVVANYVTSINLFFANSYDSSSISIRNSTLREQSQANTRYICDIENGKASTANAKRGFLFGSLAYRATVNISDSYIEEIVEGSDRLFYGEIENCYIVVSNNAGISTGGSAVNTPSLNGCYVCSVLGSLYGSGGIHLDKVSNSYFVASRDDKNCLLPISFIDSRLSGNAFSPLYQQYAAQIVEGYYDSTGNPTVDVYGSLSDPSALWPYIVSVEMFDADGNPINRVGKEEIKVRVTFNRPMDTTKDTYLTFGTIEPYADYRIDGAYVSDTVWEGTYTLKAQIENGQNFLKVNNACAAEDEAKTVFGEYQLHEFTIDTTAAMAMNLQAVAKANGIELTFAQDDYDTLLGYNIYRSTEKDGNYVKLNPAILLPTDGRFLDENAEPGKTYWYTYTVVLSDFTESKPAGKVSCMAMDTIDPTIYHTPVNQGYANNNLVISCTASDNIQIASVTLYYRAKGTSAWKSLTMSKLNDKYSATIFGNDVTMAGLEYYIVASDGVNTMQKGSADAPYAVVVKSADSLLGMGDVDGNGAVTTKDALMLMQCLNGDLLLTDDQFKRADLNGDGILSSAEALRILQYINGKVTTLEM